MHRRMDIGSHRFRIFFSHLAEKTVVLSIEKSRSGVRTIKEHENMKLINVSVSTNQISWMLRYNMNRMFISFQKCMPILSIKYMVMLCVRA